VIKEQYNDPRRCVLITLARRDYILQEGRFEKTEIQEKLFRDFRMCGAEIL
jgi:hypothetical protein